MSGQLAAEILIWRLLLVANILIERLISCRDFNWAVN